MQLSVIILNYNVRYFLEQCLISVEKALQGIESEIIVVDNNSKDDSCAMVRQKFPHIQLLENRENLGFPKGNNLGVAQAKGDYVCILNPDTVVAETTFSKVLQFITSKADNPGIVGCKLIDGRGRFLPESKRGIPTPWVAFTKIFGLYIVFPNSSWFNRYYAQHIAENETQKTEVLVGAFMMLKRDLYNEIDGFDENCFMYSDDIDLSYRVLQKGYSNYYFSDATVVHYKGESSVRDSDYVKRFSEAMTYFYKKHYGGAPLFTALMKIGAFFFAKKKQSKQKAISPIFSKRLIITSDTILAAKMEAVLLSPGTVFQNERAETYEIIFDVSAISFAEILSFMQRYKATNVYFRNFIAQSDYLIGSDHADALGEIKVM